MSIYLSYVEDLAILEKSKIYLSIDRLIRLVFTCRISIATIEQAFMP